MNLSRYWQSFSEAEDGTSPCPQVEQSFFLSCPTRKCITFLFQEILSSSSSDEVQGDSESQDDLTVGRTAQNRLKKSESTGIARGRLNIRHRIKSPILTRVASGQDCDTGVDADVEWEAEGQHFRHRKTENNERLSQGRSKPKNTSAQDVLVKQAADDDLLHEKIFSKMLRVEITQRRQSYSSCSTLSSSSVFDIGRSPSITSIESALSTSFAGPSPRPKSVNTGRPERTEITAMAPRKARTTVKRVASSDSEIETRRPRAKLSRKASTNASNSVEEQAMQAPAPDDAAQGLAVSKASLHITSIYDDTLLDVESGDPESETEYSTDEDAKYLTKEAISVRSKKAYQIKYSHSTPRGLDLSLPPLSGLTDIFADMAQAAMGLGLDKIIADANKRPIRIATLCSGTESPLLALDEIRAALKSNFGLDLNYDHLFSVEIMPHKQAYIERNFAPEYIFRDIRQLSKGTEAQTAYAGWHEVPPDAQIWVAGVSCVDYSKLNNKRKNGVDHTGESSDTFKGLVKAVQKFRPPIVIIENVSGAPWEQLSAVMENNRDFGQTKNYVCELWPEDDKAYATYPIKVDTKMYYLPQTRCRGYMVCIDRRQLQNADKRVKVWRKMMRKLQRPASSSLQDFLLPDDDPRLQRARVDYGRKHDFADKSRSEKPWLKCKIRYSGYRVTNGLGFQRPLTKWVHGGSARPPDFSWRQWMLIQPERILESLEIAHLRCAARGYDSSYKSRVWDVSQNCDHDQDSHQWGCLGCITPMGLQYNTSRGGPVTGRESLALQGLPADRLLIEKETDRELIDLAGNAMSSTVVGAAILASLIAGRRAITYPDAMLKKQQQGILNKASRENSEFTMDERYLGQSQQLASNVLVGAQPGPSLIELGRRSILRCYCESSTAQAKVSLQKCRDCGHTACVRCGHISQHSYRPFEQPRTSTKFFDEEIRRQIPMVLEFIRFEDQRLGELLKGHRNVKNGITRVEYERYVRSAIFDKYFFRGTTCTRSRNANFEGEKSTLVLKITEWDAQWLLYAKPDITEPGNAQIRKYLRDPIARMVITTDDVLKGDWEVCLPTIKTTLLTITGRGELTPAWVARIGLQKERSSDAKIWPRLQIKSDPPSEEILGCNIDGLYEAFPNCGMAMDSLHKRIEPYQSNGPPLFLFLDSELIREPKMDTFVFSRNKDRLGHNESRDVAAWIESSFRLSERPVASVMCTKQGVWQKCPATLGASPWVQNGQYKVLDIQKFLRPSGHVVQHNCLHIGPGACQDGTIALLNYNMSTAGVVGFSLLEGALERSSIIAKDIVTQSTTLKPYRWLTANIRGHNAVAIPWTMIEISKDFEQCQTCAPDPPTVKWAFVKGEKRDTNLVLYEDGTEAGIYERAIKTRPPPFVVKKRITADGKEFLQVGLNIGTLVHRLVQQTKNWSGTSLSFKLENDYDAADTVNLPDYNLKSNTKDPEAGVLLPGVQLREDQQRSLSWMVAQENEGDRNFKHVEVLEAALPELGWRAEVRAEGILDVRGGILGDDVGYGKTATSLALIHAQYDDAQDHAQASVDGCIPLKATLIVVPENLTRQWKDQVTKFLGNNYTVLVINTRTKPKYAQIMSADIIVIARNIFDNDKYWNTFAILAALPGKPTKGDRALSAWIDKAIPKIENHVDMLIRRSPRQVAKILKRKLKAELGSKLDGETVFRRRRGAQYAAHEEEIAQKEVTESKHHRFLTTDHKKQDSKFLNRSNLDDMVINCLHIFRFSRIILDEFTYATSKEHKAITTLKTRYRWLLSATFAKENYANVASVAKAFGVDLGGPEESAGFLQHADLNKARREKTDGELFRDLSRSNTIAWHIGLQEQAQAFLNHYARRNVADVSSIPMDERLVTVSMTAVERIIYLEMQQQLLCQDFEVSLGVRVFDNSDEMRRLQGLSRNAHTTAEALIKCCTLTKSESSHDQDQMARLGDLISTRYNQMQSTMKDLRYYFKHMAWLNAKCAAYSSNPAVEYTDWKKGIEAGDLGDLGAFRVIYDLVRRAEESVLGGDEDIFYKDEHTPAEKLIFRMIKKQVQEADIITKTEWDRLRGDPRPFKFNFKKPKMDSKLKEALRNCLGQVIRLSSEYVSRLRGLRFTFKARKLLGNLNQKTECLVCDGCQIQADPATMFMLTSCGHIFCETCEETVGWKTGTCGVKGCGAASSDHLHLSISTLLGDNVHQDEPAYSSKMASLVSLIKYDIPENDQILLFVQFEDLLAQIAAALRGSGILIQRLSGEGSKGSNKAGNLYRFQNSNAKQAKVLILNSADDSAAGANLTNANHVIFASPLQANHQQHWNSQYKQAIGRSRRYGQTKTVYVYHFVALRTLEIDLIQTWTDEKVVYREKKAQWALVAKDELTEDEKTQNFATGFAA